MKINRIKRKIGFRGPLMILLVFLLPVLLIIYSPVKIIIGSLNGFMTLSSIIFIIWMGSALFVGRGMACGYLCPYGALQEVIGKLLNKKARSNNGSKMKYLSFIGFLGIILYSRATLEGNKTFDPLLINSQISFMNITSSDVMILAAAFMLLVGITSLLGSRAFCRYLCPQAVFLNISSKISKWINIPSLKLKADCEKCNDCRRCDTVCPMGLEVMQMVKSTKLKHPIYSPDCILCGDCVRACKKKSIDYSFD